LGGGIENEQGVGDGCSDGATLCGGHTGNEQTSFGGSICIQIKQCFGVWRGAGSVDAYVLGNTVESKKLKVKS